MSTGFFTDPICLKHFAGPRHPESPVRLEAIVRGIEDQGLLGKLKELNLSEMEQDQALAWITQVHSQNQLNDIKSACEDEASLDPDTHVVKESWSAALRSSAGVIKLCDEVASRKLSNGFAAIRPPGHHSESNKSMGFCLVNHIAVAAEFLRMNSKFERVLIIDWDVHHGNGTQEIFYHRPDVFYLSSHQYPFYPGTGASSETGVGQGEGYTKNIPLEAGTDSEKFLFLFEPVLEQVFRDYLPDFVLISSGFDAHERDPLGELNLRSDTFGELTGLVMKFALEYCSGRVVSVLEGGYNPLALSESVNAHVKRLLD